MKVYIGSTATNESKEVLIEKFKQKNATAKNIQYSQDETLPFIDEQGNQCALIAYHIYYDL